jgi:hypothetical protein
MIREAVCGEESRLCHVSLLTINYQKIKDATTSRFEEIHYDETGDFESL